MPVAWPPSRSSAAARRRRRPRCSRVRRPTTASASIPLAAALAAIALNTTFEEVKPRQESGDVERLVRATAVCRRRHGRRRGSGCSLRGVVTPEQPPRRRQAHQDPGVGPAPPLTPMPGWLGVSLRRAGAAPRPPWARRWWWWQTRWARKDRTCSGLERGRPRTKLGTSARQATIVGTSPRADAVPNARPPAQLARPRTRPA